jgi:hypothetical protein
MGFVLAVKGGIDVGEFDLRPQFDDQLLAVIQEGHMPSGAFQRALMRPGPAGTCGCSDWVTI